MDKLRYDVWSPEQHISHKKMTDTKISTYYYLDRIVSYLGSTFSFQGRLRFGCVAVLSTLPVVLEGLSSLPMWTSFGQER